MRLLPISVFSRTLLALPLLICLALTARADPLPAPEGPVILTLETAEGEAMTFDLAMLQALPVTEYQTNTIWTDGPQVFTGVLLRDLFGEFDLRGRLIRAHAVNDYAVDIPWTDASRGHALLAYKRNGKTMSVREKGPLWIVFPYDSHTRFRQETYHSRSIWQLDRLRLQD